MRDPKSDVDGWKPSRHHVLEAIGTATASGIFLVRLERPTLENVEMTTDHDGVRTEEAAKQLAYEWLSTPLSPDARRQD